MFAWKQVLKYNVHGLDKAENIGKILNTLV